MRSVKIYLSFGENNVLQIYVFNFSTHFLNPLIFKNQWKSGNISKKPKRFACKESLRTTLYRF